MAPVNGDHLGVLFWGDRPKDAARPKIDNAGWIQFMPPHGAMWDYHPPKHHNLPHETLAKGSRDFTRWCTTELLCNLEKGTIRAAVDGVEIAQYTHSHPGERHDPENAHHPGAIGMFRHGGRVRIQGHLSRGRSEVGTIAHRAMSPMTRLDGPDDIRPEIRRVGYRRRRVVPPLVDGGAVAARIASSIAIRMHRVPVLSPPGLFSRIRSRMISGGPAEESRRTRSGATPVFEIPWHAPRADGHVPPETDPPGRRLP